MNRSTCAIALVLAGLLGATSPQARAFGLFSSTTTASGFSDIVNNPNDHWWWDLNTITYAFDPSFNTLFPNPRIRDQVRLAFRQWDDAFSTANGAIYSYNRANGFQPFVDIRSVMVHEIGHVLGLGHPNQAAPANRNYRPSGATYVAQPVQGNELMRSWINEGDYNHLLTHDELDAFRFVYGTRNLNFTEVASAASANIVIRTYNPGNPNNWAQGPPSGVFRNPANQSQGVRITSGIVQFNMAPVNPLGFRSLGINWDYQNTSGQPTRSFRIRTRGTDNLTPMFHYDNNGPRRFLTFTTAAVGVNNKDDLLHTWSNPNGGDIPAAELLHVGLEQDVWDWSVVSASTISPGGSATAAPLVGFHDWNNTIVIGTPALNAHAEEGIGRMGLARVLARGFRLVNTDVSARVSAVALADVTGMGLKLDQLNRATMLRLRDSQRLQFLPDFKPISLGPDRDFIFVLEGKEGDLPDRVREQGNFVLLNRPDLLDRELFLFATSDNEKGQAGTYALVATPATAQVMLPKLEISRLRDGSTRLCWPNPSEGFVLQSSPTLTPARWTTVLAQAEIINNKKCVTLVGQLNMQFFRLVYDQKQPVYRVAFAGIPQENALRLAEELKIPRDQLAFQDGLAMFVDPVNFQSIPVARVQDPVLIRELTESSENDGGQLLFESINFNALRELRPIDTRTALAITDQAFQRAQLIPQNAQPMATHTLFDAFNNKDQPILENAPIDTQVSYHFSLNGVPLVGPGAQVSISYDPNGRATALLYASRQVVPAGDVAIIPPWEAANRCARLFPQAQAGADPALIYYAPPLSLTSVQLLVPCYDCGGTAVVDGQPISMLRTIIPATDDPSLVPELKLSASARGTLVTAQVDVNGGARPYTFVWISSSADLGGFPPDAARIQYDAQTRSQGPFTETVRVLVTDANGVQVQASETLLINPQGLAEPPMAGNAPEVGGVADFGCERAVSDMGAAQQSGFVNRFLNEGITRRFNFTGLSAWERDFKEGGTGLDQFYVDNADIVFYIGHGNPDGITFESLRDDGTLSYTDAAGAWGDLDLEWLALLSCQVLADESGGRRWYQRWGPTFDGLHLLLGFETNAHDWPAFGGRFAEYVLGRRIGILTLPPLPIRAAWFQAKREEQPAGNVAVVMGVYGPGGVSNYNDYFWGKGPVGGDLRGANIHGWWRVRFQ